MTIEEARVCADLFAEERRGEVPDEVVDEVRTILKEACERFPNIIGEIEPGNMGRLFKLFRVVIFRVVSGELGEKLTLSLSQKLGLNVTLIMADFREFFDDGPDNLPPEEEERFRKLTEGLSLEQ